MSGQFAGVVQGLTIGSRPIAGRPHDWLLSSVDMTAARPRNLQLVGVDLGQVDIRLPADADHWLVPGWPATCSASLRPLPRYRKAI